MRDFEHGQPVNTTNTDRGATTDAPAMGGAGPSTLAQAVRWRAIQRRAAQRRAASQAASMGAPSDTAAPAGAGRPLPEATQAKMERSFGADFSDVRVHEGGQAQQMGAMAFAQGNDIHFQPGQFAPGGAAGDALIGHELAHVVQQRAGRVESPQGKGAPIVDNAGLEAEADSAGDRAARGEPAGIAGGSGQPQGGLQRKVDPIQRQEAAKSEGAQSGAPGKGKGADTFGLGAFLDKVGVSGGIGKFAEATLAITSPPIPQLAGASVEGEVEGRYLTKADGAELETSLKIGLSWGIKFGPIHAKVKVFGEGKLKLEAKNGEMLSCLNAAAKGVLWDGIQQTNLANLVTLASPLASKVAEWQLGKQKWAEMQSWNLFKVLQYFANLKSAWVPSAVNREAQGLVSAMTAFFGTHTGRYEVEAAIGVGAEGGGGKDGKGLAGGADAKAVHGIEGKDGEKVMDQKSRSEFAVEGYLKKDENEAKIGYVFGGGRNVLSLEGTLVTEDHTDFDKAKILSLTGILKLAAAAGFGKSVADAKQAPNGGALANAVVSALASGAAAVSNQKLPGLKKSYKLSFEAEREGESSWKTAKVDAKLFLGRTVGGDMDAGKMGKVEAHATVGSYLDISHEAKAKVSEAAA